MDGPAMSRADSTTRRATPTFQRPLSRPGSSRIPVGGGSRPPGGAAVKHRPISYDYATGSTFSVKINGKPVFLLNDFRKKVDEKVQGKRYVTAFKNALAQQREDKKHQDAVRDQYERNIVPRFRAVEHTETGLTKNVLGLADDKVGRTEPLCIQGEIGHSRIDKIDPWEAKLGNGLEKYQPCTTSICAPPPYVGLDYTHPQWQREPSSHLELNFVYGYQGASCWDHKLFGEGPGQDNLFFVQDFNQDLGCMSYTSEIIYFAAATVVVFHLKDNVQRFFHHSDDVTSIALLKRVYQKPDATWTEMDRPLGSKATVEWLKWACFCKGVYKPNEKDWEPSSLLLPMSSDDYPQLIDGRPNDWRDWDLPNRCIVASGQKGKNPVIRVWRIPTYDGERDLNRQLLATMHMGNKLLSVAALSFNSGGNLLLALASDFEKVICVFDWRRETKIRTGTAYTGIVESCRFNPYSASAFATCGEKHLKFWELGETEFETAVGLLGDIGKPISDKIVCFTPKGNTLTGMENGDIYIWAAGSVTGKIENAHKFEVLGLLYVDNVGLFSCGRGGHLKLWDPELLDTRTPLFALDLGCFAVNGSAKLNARISGRSMDWSTSRELLALLCDDCMVEDDLSKGICGSPATHMSFADFRAEGVLLIGTTTNSIIAVGMKRVSESRSAVLDPRAGSWANDGLGEDFEINGDSVNTESGTLRDQKWWDLPTVNKYKGKFGAKQGHLPVAVYSYQTFNESQAGFRSREAGGRMGRCPWKWAVSGKKICMRGHMSVVSGVAPNPTDRIFLSVSSDCTARLYDMNDHVMNDSAPVIKPARSATWWCIRDNIEGVNADVLGVGRGASFAVGHDDGSFSIWLTEKSAATAAAQDDEEARDIDPFFNPEDAFGVISLCCVNPLPRKVALDPGRGPSEHANQVKYSPNGKYFAVALGDNCIDIYRHALVHFEERPLKEEQIEKAKQKALGFTDEEIERQNYFPYRRVGCCNDHSAAVLHFDFDSFSAYIRSVSNDNELLYAYVPSGRQNQSLTEMATKNWATENCTLGWTVKSIWALGTAGNDVNSIDKSVYKVPPWASAFGGNEPAPCPPPNGFLSKGTFEPIDVFQTNNFPGEGVASSWGHHVCVTGDDFGKVKLFRWPAFGFKQAYRAYLGHGSHVAEVRFSHDNDFVISAGGADMSIFQWRHCVPNKIYIKNLPNKRDAYGKFTINDFELREHLIGTFSQLLKAARWKAEPVSRLRSEQRFAGRSQVSHFDTKLKEALSLENHVSLSHLKKLEFDIRMQRASREEPTDEDDYIPDRQVVSCAVFASGAQEAVKFFPSQEEGCPITERWASITFCTSDEMEDVISLFGGNNVLSHPELYKQGFLRLCPLYKCVDANDPEFIRGSKVLDDPLKPPVMQVRTDRLDPVSGKPVTTCWVPIGDADFEEGDRNGGKPHFMYVNKYDSCTVDMHWVYSEAMLKITEEMKHRAKITRNSQEDLPYPSTIDEVIEYSQQCGKEWDWVEKWSNSDEKYGMTYPKREVLANYPLWKKYQTMKGKAHR